MNEDLVEAAARLVHEAAALRERITSASGSAGAAWFDGLPAAVGVLADRFGLSQLGPLRQGTWSLVVDAEIADGTPAVLKLVPPFRTPTWSSKCSSEHGVAAV